MTHALSPWRRRALLIGCSVWALAQGALTPLWWWQREGVPGELVWIVVGSAWAVAGLVTAIPWRIDIAPLARALAVTGCFTAMDQVGAGDWAVWWVVLPLWLCALLSALSASRRAFLASSLVLLAGTLSLASAPRIGGGWHGPHLLGLGPWFSELAVRDAPLVIAACAVVLVAAVSSLAQRPHSGGERWLSIGVAIAAVGLAAVELQDARAAQPVADILHMGAAALPAGHIQRLASGAADITWWAGLTASAALAIGWLSSHGGTRARGARNAWAWVLAPGLLVLCVAMLRAPGRYARDPQPPLDGLRLPAPSWPRGRPPTPLGAARRVTQVVLGRSGEAFLVTAGGLEPLEIGPEDRLDVGLGDTVVAFLDADADLASAFRLLAFLESDADVWVAVAGGPEPDRSRSQERWVGQPGEDRVKSTVDGADRHAFARALYPFALRPVRFGYEDGRCQLPSGRSCTPPFTVEGVLEEIALQGCDALEVFPLDATGPPIPDWSAASESTVRRLRPPTVPAELTAIVTRPPPPRRWPSWLTLGSSLGALLVLLVAFGAASRRERRTSWVRPRDLRALPRHDLGSYRESTHRRRAPLGRGGLLRALVHRALLASTRVLPYGMVAISALIGLLLGGAFG